MIVKSTQPTKADQITREWHHVDLKDQTLGRAATKIAELLMGKNKPYFVRNMDCGDYVVVTNAKDFVTTGNKDMQKVYTNYSGFPGGLRKETLGKLKERRPEEVIRHAVSGMLPKNKLRDQALKRLHVYVGEDHPYGEKLKGDTK